VCSAACAAAASVSVSVRVAASYVGACAVSVERATASGSVPASPPSGTVTVYPALATAEAASRRASPNVTLITVSPSKDARGTGGAPSAVSGASIDPPAGGVLPCASASALPAASSTTPAAGTV